MVKNGKKSKAEDQNWKLHILHNFIHQHDPTKHFIKTQSLLQTFNSCRLNVKKHLFEEKEI